MEFFADDVKRITGVQRLRLHNWMKEGFIVPSGQVAKGHGTKNIYTIDDLYRIALFKKLIENGMHGFQASLFTKHLSNHTWKLQKKLKEEGLPGLILCAGLNFVSGKNAYIEPWIDIISEPRTGTNRDTGIEVRRLFTELNFDQVIAINIEKLVDDVDSLI